MRTSVDIKKEIVALQEQLKALRPERPARLSIRDLKLENLISLVDSYIEFVWSPEENPDRNGLEESDFRDWIFEAAVEMVHGKGIWDTIRELRK